MARRADQRKYHYIYKITRTDGSGRYYIGMHSTDDLEDGYFGSGKQLWHSINRHGKEVHSKEILEFLPTREALKLRERELVNEEILDDKLCMNLKLGGEGGSHGRSAEIWQRPEYREKMQAAVSKVKSEAWKDPQFRATMKAALIERHKQCKDLRNKRSFKGRHHTEESKQAMAEANSKMTGDKNSQYGSKWMNKDNIVKKVKHDEIEQHVQNGWNFGRK